jgi:hypothetical protein
LATRRAFFWWSRHFLSYLFEINQVRQHQGDVVPIIETVPFFAIRFGLFLSNSFFCLIRQVREQDIVQLLRAALGLT